MNLMTEKQRATIEKFGVMDYNQYMTPYQAGRLIERLIEENNQSWDERCQRANSVELTSLVSVKWMEKDGYRGTLHGPCSMCGGNDRFWINQTGNYGGCNQCHWESGNGSGAIGLYMALKNCDIRTAVTDLCGTYSVFGVRVSPKSTKPNQVTWRRKWGLRLGAAQRAFHQSQAAKYLAERLIYPSTAEYFGVGAGRMDSGPQKGKPIAVFPYFDDKGLLVALNRRVAAKVDKDKTRFVAGSRKKNGYFGVSGETGRTWVIEGEINALSVWQVLWHELGHLDTVLSLSSEGDMTGRRHEIKKQWPNALVWVDELHIAEEIAETGIKAFSSEQDANEMLKTGKLTDFVLSLLN